MHDIEEFRLETRNWLEANCPPAMRLPITQEEIVWGGSQVQFKNEDQRIWFEKMRDKGWFAPDWPKEYSGGGLSPKHARIVQTRLPPTSVQFGRLDVGPRLARDWYRRAKARTFAAHDARKNTLVPGLQ